MLSFLPQFPHIIAVLSEAADGNMKIRDLATDHDVLAHRRAFYKKNTIPEDAVVSVLLSHGTDVVTVTDATEQFFSTQDALVTGTPGVFLALTVADCLPVFFYDPVAQVIGIAHAGWRGVVGEIVPKTVAAMEKIGARAENMQVVIGPHISQKHFEFSASDFWENFGDYAKEEYIRETNNKQLTTDNNGKSKDAVGSKIFVNLSQIVVDQLESKGVDAKKIIVSPLCTMEDDRLLSSRQQGEGFGAMIGVIGINNQ